MSFEALIFPFQNSVKRNTTQEIISGICMKNSKLTLNILLLMSVGYLSFFPHIDIHSCIYSLPCALPELIKYGDVRCEVRFFIGNSFSSCTSTNEFEERAKSVVSERLLRACKYASTNWKMANANSSQAQKKTEYIKMSKNEKFTKQKRNLNKETTSTDQNRSRRSLLFLRVSVGKKNLSDVKCRLSEIVTRASWW